MNSTVPFLPTSRQEMNQRGWKTLDILLITADAYFDSPTHGVALIGRVLEREGYKVGIIARPDWTQPQVLKEMGTPSLFVGISAGAVDSTLNNYTADLAPRSDDVYAPKNESSLRPNFATAVYCGAAKGVFPHVPIVLGGIEASTRRFAYYDYLKKRIRRSVLVDTRADILVFGSGEKQAVEIATRLRQNKSLEGILGTAVLKANLLPNADAIALPSFEQLQSVPSQLLQQTQQLESGLGPYKSTAFYQQYQEGIVFCNPPATYTSTDLDSYYKLPFRRTSHPRYSEQIPASIPVRWSVIAQRGCPGGCSFCALAYHQGRTVVSRSESSILEELKTFASDSKFSGTVTDIGGPTANAYGLKYKNPQKCVHCGRSSCLYPSICDNLETSQTRFMTLLKTASRLPKIKHLFIASGIRHDLALRSPAFIVLLAQQFTGGHLKVAPEHTSEAVLKLMRKPSIAILEEFERHFIRAGNKKGLKQYLVPYFIAGFPGCTPEAANETGAWLRKRNQKLQQVQNFIPLPGTMAAAMYANETTQRGQKLFIPNAKERKRQKQLLLGTVLRKRNARSKPNAHKPRRRGTETRK